MNASRCIWLLLGCLVFVGCEKPALVAGNGPIDPGEPTQAQPKLQTMKLYIGAQEMVAELALSPQQIRTGMMFRTNMEENAGMLFALPYTQQAAFWMKNCPYPLSAAYIDTEGVIQEIVSLEPFNTNSVVAASANIRFVLETQRGWFDKHGVKPGVAIATERGPLLKTFFGNRP
jgi:uncharacterized membrane protein (UPF0127 family)